jgi:hypothetical protein
MSVRFLPPAEGGRTSAVSRGGYSPHLRVGDAGEFLGVRFVGEGELTLGRELVTSVQLMYPGVDYSVLAPGTSFQVLEGPKVVAVGTVLRRAGPSGGAA